MRETATTGVHAAVTALRARPDSELVERVRGGEQRAFEPLMRRYNRRLFRAARGIVASDAEAEDVVQETYVRAYVRLEDFRGPNGFGAWLTRIAVNEALMRRRRPNAADPVGAHDFDEDTLQEEVMAGSNRVAPTPEQETANEQLGGLLERSIDRLPENYRVAFILREIEQLSLAETAASLDIPKATVKTRVHRARRLLQRMLSNELHEAIAQAYPFAGRRCDRTVETVFRRLAGFAGNPNPGERSH